MKPVLPLILLFCSFMTEIYAQDYLITFSGNGASPSVSTVKVENLTRGTSLTLNGDQTLHLVGTITDIDPLRKPVINGLNIFPNPTSDNATVNFDLPVNGIVTISLHDISGRVIANSQENLAVGLHTFQIAGLDKGLYFVKVSSGNFSLTGRLIAFGVNGVKPEITLVNSVQVEHDEEASPEGKKKEDTESKGIATDVLMQYTTGDLLKLTGTSEIYGTVVVDVPTESKIITFSFIPCQDGDGNIYPVVEIGNQVWMAENLKTTKYNDGKILLNVTDNNQWLSLTTGAYCDYLNTPSYSYTYGKLYNWYSVTDVSNLCPTGWHVPSKDEWNTLINFLGGESIAGGKLKEGGTLHWQIPNTEATNETGFNALPGGWRDHDGQQGAFYSINRSGLWWSSSSYSTADAWNYTMFNDNSHVEWSNPDKRRGFSVRCVKDLPKNTEAFPGIKGELQDFIVNGDTLTVEKINGKYVFQGDILLTENQLNSGSGKGAGINHFIIKWPCTIYYEINDNLQHKESEIIAAINHFEASTPLDFVERMHMETNYIEFVWDTAGCSSYLGCVGGKQDISIANWATTGTVIHEIGHAVGLIHEHSRYDRNSNVIVLYNNIEPGQEHNFDIIRTWYTTTYFDFNSIMLYPSNAFSKNGFPTILMLDGSSFDVNTNSLSTNDKNVTSSIYGVETVRDIEGHIYNTVTVGKQLWMAENLRVKMLNDGTPIAWLQSDDDWNLQEENPAFCFLAGFPYNNITITNYNNVFGPLYNWYAVNTGKLCPTGWHVPNNDEWTQLAKFLDPHLYPDTITPITGYSVSCIAGSKLIRQGPENWDVWELGDWDVGQTGTNEVCFTALPGGKRTSNITFDQLNRQGYWWSASKKIDDYWNYYDGWYFAVYGDVMYKLIDRPWAGLSVRCVKD